MRNGLRMAACAIGLQNADGAWAVAMKHYDRKAAGLDDRLHRRRCWWNRSMKKRAPKLEGGDRNIRGAILYGHESNYGTVRDGSPRYSAAKRKHGSQ